MSTRHTYYLEMHSPEQLREAALDWKMSGLDLCEIARPQFQFNRFLYQLVGEAYQWHDRLAWADAQWKELVASAHLRTWVAYSQGAIAGYFELRQQGSDTEILYFGLAPGFIGRGLGGTLLQAAIEQAWAWQATRRVWVHTCTDDHPAALSNYQARGFKLYDTIDGGHPDEC